MRRGRAVATAVRRALGRVFDRLDDEWLFVMQKLENRRKRRRAYATAALRAGWVGLDDLPPDERLLEFSDD